MNSLTKEGNGQTEGVELFYSPLDLVERYKGRVTLRTLANWRSTGISPPYTKIGGRILYPVDRLIEWEKSRTVQGTMEYKK